MEKRPNRNIIFVGAVVALVGVVFAFVLLRGNEDTWLCVDGAWVKHGNPSAPAPDIGCGTAAAAATAGALFVKTGNLVGGPSAWRLLFEEPGKPALSVSLQFTGASICDGKSCVTSSLGPVGTRVHVTGERSGDTVTVETLGTVSP